ncbi:hypothetical protein OG436_29510 [Streptomyces caniferus]|uniref:hypothetical protein n=1 Tax=Streptomyces caniferus TaxID=285557 RepID=UPI002E295655|nr:hypothetical protein [Streptomyces caniferus]
MTARFNVRGELVAMVCNGCSGASDEAAEQWADDMLREHARQLAERIRNSETLRDWTDDHMGDCNMAADLIDPEVTTA